MSYHFDAYMYIANNIWTKSDGSLSSNLTGDNSDCFHDVCCLVHLIIFNQRKKTDNIFKTKLLACLGLILSQNHLPYEHSIHVVLYMLTYIYISFLKVMRPFYTLALFER